MAEERQSNSFLFLLLIGGLIWYFFRDSFNAAGSVAAPVIQNNGGATISAGQAPMVSAVSPNMPSPVPGANPLNPNLPLTPAFAPSSTPISQIRIATETFGVAPSPVLGRQTSTPENGGTFFPPPAPAPVPAPTVYRNPFTGFQFTAATAVASRNGFVKVAF